MRFVDGQLLLAPTDLATFISCRHRTGLDLAVARGVLRKPIDDDPYAAMLRAKGEAHEREYVDTLRARGASVVVIERGDGPVAAERLARQTADTFAAMRDGADVIVQGRLAHGAMAGYADVLVRVERESDLGGWSYEPQDTKLARDTKGTAILQLCGYAELLARMQGVLPAWFHVVTPDPVAPVQSYRTGDYLAYYRTVRASLAAALAQGDDALREVHYPEPVAHCDVCAWDARCRARRRKDDHLSLIAGSTRAHRQELTAQGYATLTAAASMPVPVAFTPARGGRDAYERLGHQARLQHQQRSEGRPVFERLPLVAGEGLARLPQPSPGDVFLDLEGARFAREGGREFLFGLWSCAGETSAEGLPARGVYRAWWATNDADEKQAFEAVMDLILAAWQADPGMHVYHFNHYEPTAFKKLVGRHVTRAESLDALLRAERFVDLYTVARQAVRCGVESYSIKQLEAYYGFARQVTLGSVASPLMAVELALDAQTPQAITADIRDAVQGYNQDDCRSAAGLRDWLEELRAEAVAGGAVLARPAAPDGDASIAVSELQQKVDGLRQRLLDGLPLEAGERTHPDHARWLLAYLIDWHRREENADWWEYFRLKDLPVAQLFDEREAIAGLSLVTRVGFVAGKGGKPTRSVIDRYTYPPQEVEIGAKGALHARDGKSFGKVVSHDRLRRVIEIEKGPSRAEQHPGEVFSCAVVSTKGLQQSVMRLAERWLAGEGDDCGAALLRRGSPRVRGGRFERAEGEAAADFAVRVVTDLDRTTLAIQGPPGTGKTFTGARMIRALVAAGRRVGVAANSHKVIRNLLDEVAGQAAEAGETVRLGAKVGDGEDEAGGSVRTFTTNEDARAALGSDLDVLGGTAWLWSREEFAGAVDVLFVDEAGQMSLANALAVSQAADSLVLLGDPRQLDQPQKATHPDGVGVSALDHVLNGAETMPEDRGIFLPVTFRMAPAITRFTAELFYDHRLAAQPGLERQALVGAGPFDGAGLWLIPVDHDTNQTASVEEVDAVTSLVRALLGSGTIPPGFAADSATVAETSAKPRGIVPDPHWVDQHGRTHRLTPGDLRVVAPFNAQVNRLAERLAPLGVPVGTVDKFQGQTAAVVIYSMSTSRAEDAPRGMEFLYSLDRLNVATSRARCAVFLVCSPRLLAPECRTPRQMRLANALCRYRELARSWPPT